MHPRYPLFPPASHDTVLPPVEEARCHFGTGGASSSPVDRTLSEADTIRALGRQPSGASSKRAIGQNVPVRYKSNPGVALLMELQSNP